MAIHCMGILFPVACLRTALSSYLSVFLPQPLYSLSEELIATELKRLPSAVLTDICVPRTSFSVATPKTHDHLNPSPVPF